jgi:hypothetical protein
MTPQAPGAAPATSGCAAVRVAVCDDGCFYQHAARYFAWERGTQISLAGLHDVIRWHAPALFGCPVHQVAITAARYIAGQGTSPPGWGPRTRRPRHHRPRSARHHRQGQGRR